MSKGSGLITPHAHGKIKCPFCGQVVPRFRKTKKFCSPKCRTYYWRQQQYKKDV